MLLLFIYIYREHHRVMFLSILIEAGVDNAFSKLVSAQFRIYYACSVRSPSRFTILCLPNLRIWLALPPRTDMKWQARCIVPDAILTYLWNHLNHFYHSF